MSCTTGSTGLNFSVSLTRDGDVLNEDRPGQDELYAYIYFLDIRTGTDPRGRLPGGDPATSRSPHPRTERRGPLNGEGALFGAVGGTVRS